MPPPDAQNDANQPKADESPYQMGACSTFMTHYIGSGDPPKDAQRP